MFLSKSKKGTIEVQFGWIFVVVVGSLILLFFFTIVKNTSKASSEGTLVDLKEHLDNMFSQVITDVGGQNSATLPQITLDFSNCNEVNIEKSSTAGKDTSYKTIFSPDKIKGREMMTYSLYWAVPYNVDYFLYITSNQARYTFINDTSCAGSQKCQNLLNDILRNMPSNATYNVTSMSTNVKENNNYKERFIFFNKTPTAVDSSIGQMRNEDVTAINIADSNNYGGIYSYPAGSVVFYKKSSNSFVLENTSAYLGFPMILGAVFSESYLYECNVKKALMKLEVMSTVYYNRTTFLKEKYNNPAIYGYRTCYPIYSSINIIDAVNAAKSREVNNAKFTVISSKAKELESSNDNAMLRSCPLIY